MGSLEAAKKEALGEKRRGRPSGGGGGIAEMLKKMQQNAQAQGGGSGEGQGGVMMKVTTETIKISNDPIDPKVFAVPEGYKLVFRALIPAPLLDDPIQLLFQARQDLVVAEGPDRLGAALQVHELGGAPESEVGVVGLAGTVHAAAHDGDGDGVVLGVARHLLHFLGELDELLVLDARAGWDRR